MTKENKKEIHTTLLVTRSEEQACKYLLHTLRGKGTLEPAQAWNSTNKNKLPYCVRCNEKEFRSLKELLKELRK